MVRRWYDPPLVLVVVVVVVVLLLLVGYFCRGYRHDVHSLSVPGANRNESLEQDDPMPPTRSRP